jgi:hypothetical protein
MNRSSYQMVAEVETRLGAATEMLAGLQWLTPVEANRVGARIDGLASQLAAVSPPDRDSVSDDKNGAN